MEKKSKAPGYVYTVYELDEDAPRLHAEAEIAIRLASDGHKVLLVDWDLSGPGLKNYFNSWPNSKLSNNFETALGLVEILEAEANGIPIKKLPIPLIRIGDFQIDCLSAGGGEETLQRLNMLDWDELYAVQDIGAYFDNLRIAWQDTYDFVVIACRKCHADVSDICTVLLPDALVFPAVDAAKADIAYALTQHVRHTRNSLPIDRGLLLSIPLALNGNMLPKDTQNLYEDWLPRDVKPRQAINDLAVETYGSTLLANSWPNQEEVDKGFSKFAGVLSERLNWEAAPIQSSFSENTIFEGDAELAVSEDSQEPDNRPEPDVASEGSGKTRIGGKMIAIVGGLVLALCAVIYILNKPPTPETPPSPAPQTCNSQEQALAQAKDDVRTALAEESAAKREVNRIKKLVSRGESSPQELKAKENLLQQKTKLHRSAVQTSTKRNTELAECKALLKSSP